MDRIDEIIRKTINNYLIENIALEYNNNLPLDDFKRDMRKLGFSIEDAEREGSRAIYKLPHENGTLKITTHDTRDNAKADMLRHVVRGLKSINWFDDKENFKKFPFSTWGIKPSSIYVDTTKDEILNANKEYENAEIYRVFYKSNNPLCLMKVNNKFNLCASINDRRPLLDTWFDEFEYSRENGKPMISIYSNDEYDDIILEKYYILPNGELDYDNVIIER